MRINMGAMLLLVAILNASLATAVRPSDNQDILMVVDKPLSPFSGGADLEFRSFLVPDGKSLTLSRQRQPGKLGCSGSGGYCDLGTWCCGSLTCSSSFSGGTCSQVHPCSAAGGSCDAEGGDDCCYPLRCNSLHGGTCIS